MNQSQAKENIKIVTVTAHIQLEENTADFISFMLNKSYLNSSNYLLSEQNIFIHRFTLSESK
jgi:hypothetical protein